MHNMTIREKFAVLGVDNAPGQESSRKEESLTLRGEPIPGTPVDFSHGDVDAHEPTPGSLALFDAGFEEGASQAYTPYKGKTAILRETAEKISRFVGRSFDPDTELILTPGTQGALFLAMGANIMPGDKVAIVEPDYFANRKMVEFFHGELVSVPIDWMGTETGAGLDLGRLEECFRTGVKLFLFSNPNNPTGCIYSREEIETIARLAGKYHVTLIVDELYSRQIYDGTPYCHLCALKNAPSDTVTIMGPSKTESLSGFRLGAAFGHAEIIERMEKLQAIMALRCSGYNQAVFGCWFREPEGWLEARIQEHRRIRDDIMSLVRARPDLSARPTEGGSYLFITIPELDVSLHEFIRLARKYAAVTVTPGTEFGPQFLHQFRINFSQDHDDAVAAVERLFTLMDRYKKA